MGVLRRDPPNNEALDVHDVHTILGPESQFEGKLVFEGTVRIDGKFKGEVHTDGSLVIGHGAKVEGHVRAGHIIVHGEVEGELVAREVIEIHAPAVVRGSITTPQLMVAKGVRFDGQSHMAEAAQAAANVTPIARGHKE